MFTPKFTVTPLLQRQLIAIERTRGFLDAVRLRPDWQASLRQKAQVQDALSSVQVEGNSLTLETAYRLAESPPSSLSDNEREFLNYLNAFELIGDLRGVRDYRVGKRDLLNLHHTLVSGVRGGSRYAGRLRNEEVVVGDRIDGQTVVHHHPPPWTEAEDHLLAMFDWCEACKTKPTRADLAVGAQDPWVHPVLIAGVAQHRLVWIHPFVDGNGRTARMLTALLLYIRGYDFKFLFDLSSYYNANRDAYYAALRTADETGDYTPWLEYFVGGFSMQMYRIQETAADAVEVVEPEEDEITTEVGPIV